MSLLLYVDEHVQEAITHGLRLRNVDVLTAQEDGHRNTDDGIILDRAMELGRVVFTRDADFLKKTTERLSSGRAFGGVIYAHMMGPSIGQCVKDIELIAKVYDLADIKQSVEYLPLK